MNASDLEMRMRKSLIQLGLGHWSVSWHPNSSPKMHGQAIPSKLLIDIYDVDEGDAWDTFIHEVIEIKLRSALRPYRILMNKLIEGYQEITDGEKDRFIEGLSAVFEVARGSPPSS